MLNGQVGTFIYFFTGSNGIPSCARSRSPVTTEAGLPTLPPPPATIPPPLPPPLKKAEEEAERERMEVAPVVAPASSEGGPARVGRPVEAVAATEEGCRR